jgi:hypothetical protein
MEIHQPCSQGANAVEAGGAKDKGAGFIITNAHMEAAIGLAVATGCQITSFWCRAWQGLYTRRQGTPAGLAIAHTQGSTRLSVKQVVAGSQIQIGIVKEQSHRNTSKFSARCCTQCFIDWVGDPAIFGPDLAGEGEFVILCREAFAIFLHHPTDGDSANHRGSYGQSFEHDRSFQCFEWGFE